MITVNLQQYIPNLICLVVDGSIHWSSSPLREPILKKKLANMLEPTSKRNNSNFLFTHYQYVSK